MIFFSVQFSRWSNINVGPRRKLQGFAGRGLHTKMNRGVIFTAWPAYGITRLMFGRDPRPSVLHAWHTGRRSFHVLVFFFLFGCLLGCLVWQPRTLYLTLAPLALLLAFWAHPFSPDGELNLTAGPLRSMVIMTKCERGHPAETLVLSFREFLFTPLFLSCYRVSTTQQLCIQWSPCSSVQTSSDSCTTMVPYLVRTLKVRSSLRTQRNCKAKGAAGPNVGDFARTMYMRQARLSTSLTGPSTATVVSSNKYYSRPELSPLL